MRNQKRRIPQILYLSILLYLMGHAPCFASDKVKTTAPQEIATQDTITTEEYTRYKHFFLQAQLESQKGNKDAAFEYLQHCININPNASEAYFYLARCYFELNEFEEGAKMLKHAVKLEPSNYWYLDALASYYLRDREYANAIELYELMSKQFPERTENLRYLTSLYLQNDRPEDAINTLNLLEVKEGKSEELSVTKVRLFLELEQPQKAFAEIKNLIKEYPIEVR